MLCKDHGRKGNIGGYASQKRNGKTQYMHRLAYADAHGIAIEELDGHVRHTCDNSRCIEPTHLLLGTHQDNMDDRTSRGRHRGGKGDSHGMAVLTSEIVEAIRKRYKPRCRINGCRALGREFNVGNHTVSDIVTGKTWRQV